MNVIPEKQCTCTMRTGHGTSLLEWFLPPQGALRFAVTFSESSAFAKTLFIHSAAETRIPRQQQVFRVFNSERIHRETADRLEKLSPSRVRPQLVPKPAEPPRFPSGTKKKNPLGTGVSGFSPWSG
ncbi:hypothetical protein [Alicyclobacillus cellulosilyticus]|uniref:hypothetical protein n=1 Tax=Alicyclobacillus cellulosilyticus TaxID=1003997 RepID=UPI0016640D62|nr:hypothetical protein [Alicyclobacillus cellulosilyticus]